MAMLRFHGLAFILAPFLIAASALPDNAPIPTTRPQIEPAEGESLKQDDEVHIPLPTPRPEVAEDNSEPDEPAPLTAEEVSCLADLVELEVEFKVVDPIHGEGQCGVDHPIKVKSLSSGVALDPPGVMTCATALSLENWTRETVEPAVDAIFDDELAAIGNYSTYVCRTRNSQTGAKISEHAKGNAIDIGRFVLEGGRVIEVRSPPLTEFLEKGFLYAIREDACDHFTTVLGPGSDVFHADHFHLDMIQRRSGYRYCK
ncbi:MAG: extensin [Rhizobiaceae bacterium MnEN-MB40S]|nr:MAG: extensin [Rhizobiaceae bacterium MnEN-MB40S]